MTTNTEQSLLDRAYPLLVEFQKTIDNSMEGDHPARGDLEGLLQDIERQQSQVARQLAAARCRHKPSFGG